MSSQEKLEHKIAKAGQLLFAREWVFTKGIPKLSLIDAPYGIEIAFAGRSNVGKSSLLNALTGQKTLARTSNTPGRTQHLNFFQCEEGLTLVDMPGYGFAKAPVSVVEKWQKLIRQYLAGRPNLARVFVLIDARHGIKNTDIEVLDMLDKTAVSYQIILTKEDKLKPSQRIEIIEKTQKDIAKRPAAFPEILMTSSVKKNGMDTVHKAVATILYEQGMLNV